VKSRRTGKKTEVEDWEKGGGRPSFKTQPKDLVGIRGRSVWDHVFKKKYFSINSKRKSKDYQDASAGKRGERQGILKDYGIKKISHNLIKRQEKRQAGCFRDQKGGEGRRESEIWRGWEEGGNKVDTSCREEFLFPGDREGEEGCHFTIKFTQE